jgi:two-component system, OmpR family, heavy metal sensor histidine kinase CusS
MLFLASADQGSKASKLTKAPWPMKWRPPWTIWSSFLKTPRCRCTVSGDAQVNIEKAHLRRALINLLNNAVQHTEPGQVIEVRIEQTARAAGLISVSNPGEPIAGEHLPRLFERFYRVDASRHNSGANHGLGLAIVKAIARCMAGRCLCAVNTVATPLVSPCRSEFQNHSDISPFP